MIDPKCTKETWVRRGLTPDDCQERINAMAPGLGKWGKYNDVYGPTTPECPTFESYTGRSDDLFVCLQQIQLTHLGVTHPFGQISEIIDTASELAVDLFCGSWRNHALLHSGEILNNEQCRVHYDQWFDYYRIGLLVTLLKNDPQHVTQVAQYIGDDLYPDEGYWDRDANDRLVYSLVSEFICTNKSSLDAAEGILKGRSKRPKLMLGILRAIEKKDSVEFEKPFRELVKHFKRSDLHSRSRVLISIDASVMWNLARYSGVVIRKLGDDVMDFVITSESVTCGQ